MGPLEAWMQTMHAERKQFAVPHLFFEQVIRSIRNLNCGQNSPRIQNFILPDYGDARYSSTEQIPLCICVH